MISVRFITKDRVFTIPRWHVRTVTRNYAGYMNTSMFDWWMILHRSKLRKVRLIPLYAVGSTMRIHHANSSRFAILFNARNSLSAGSISAIYRQTHASDPASIITSQNNSHFGNIIWEARSLQRVPSVQIIPRSQMRRCFLKNCSLSI